MRLILVRHGECKGNLEDRAVGRDDSPLTEHGREQATTIARHLVHEQVAAVYSSTLSRAYDTALPIAAAHGLVVKQDPRIIEIDFGSFSGKVGDFKGTRALIEQARLNGVDSFTYSVGGGESIEHVVKRARPFFDELVERHHRQTVVVVSHGGLIRIMVQQLIRLSHEDLVATKHENTAYTILELAEDGSYRAHVIAATDHL